MLTIWYKRQLFGFRRDDGKVKKHVSEEFVLAEIIELVQDGWEVNLHGVNYLRSIEVYKKI